MIENGEIYVFGRNNEGQLGLGNNNDQNKPVLLMKDDQVKDIFCGHVHTLFVKGKIIIYFIFFIY